jgi:hypothetical protein
MPEHLTVTAVKRNDPHACQLQGRAIAPDREIACRLDSGIAVVGGTCRGRSDRGVADPHEVYRRSTPWSHSSVLHAGIFWDGGAKYRGLWGDGASR